MTENEVSGICVDCAYKVHAALGPGLLESTYETALALEFSRRGIHFVQQPVLPVVYDGVTIEHAYRVDFIVEDMVILELKSVESVAPVHKRQLLTYLRLSRIRIGLLLNFNVVLIKNGITRVVDGFDGRK